MLFYKYNATGNDFILIEGNALDSLITKRLCYENEIGADGIIYLTRKSQEVSEIEIYNKDGSKAKVCGNALRIIAFHLLEVYGYERDSFKVKVGSETYECGKDTDGYYATFKRPKALVLKENEGIFEAPNLHLVRLVSEIDLARLFEMGTLYKSLFNTHELYKINDSTYAFVSFERGVGITDSCVSGAISAYAFLLSFDESLVRVTFKTIGGDLYLSKVEDKLIASGSVRLVYLGEMDDETLFK